MTLAKTLIAAALLGGVAIAAQAQPRHEPRHRVVHHHRHPVHHHHHHRHVVR